MVCRVPRTYHREGRDAIAKSAEDSAPSEAAAGSTSAQPITDPQSQPGTPGHRIADDEGIPIPLPTWPAPAYAGIVDGPGADKLSASAIAPLIACARGYRHVEETDAHIAAKLLRLGTAKTRRYQSLVSILTDGGGAMMMPRYKPEAARQYREGERKLPFVEIAEFRPVMKILAANSDPDAPPQELKYKGIFGSAAVLDLHPATPPEWLDHTSMLLIAEGVLKGDSGLTALLRRSGVPDLELTTIPANQSLAVDKLRELMRAIPAQLQTMIVSTGGVAAWHNNPEWNDLNLRGRRVWLAFDGDVAANRKVWKQATQLWHYLEASKKATPVWLDLMRVAGDDGVKVQTGLDDYLAEIGPWQSLLPRLRKALPPAPPADTTARRPAKGDMRINGDDAAAEEYDTHLDSNGNQVGYWKQVAALAGRVVELISLREASDRDIETAVISEAPAKNTNVSVEVSFFDEENVRHRHLISGPDSLLAEAPSEWHKSRVGAFVPPEVKAHPDWPPNLKWLQAVKAHRRDEIARPTQWQHMGWVPTAAHGNPVFIIGDQVIGRDGFAQDMAIPGVDEDLLAGASKFGVTEPEDTDDLRRAIRTVFAIYTKAWTDPRYAAAVLAYGLRPVVPLPSSSPGSFIGNRKTAKSWSAAAAMYFWQHSPGTWSNKGLPGSASDTAASTEMAVSRTPIWVIDDLAPGPDARAEQMESRKLNDVLRAVANRTARRRANAEMGSQAVHPPRAVLMVTSENNRFAASVESRYLLLEFQRGALDSAAMKQLDALGANSCDAAKITFAALQMIASGSFLSVGEDHQVSATWERIIDSLKKEQRAFEMAAEVAMPEPVGSKRDWGVAADICMGLWVLEQLCYVTEGLDDIGDQIYPMRDLIISMSQQHLHDQSNRTPGAAILAAVRATLASGQAHIGSADTPGAPPIVGVQDSNLVATRLGWLPDGSGGMRAGGPSIGTLVRANDDDPVILLDAQNAFTISARFNRDSVMFGSTPSQAWRSAWNEGLTCPDGDPYKRQESNGSKRLEVRALNGRVRGVPFRLSTILDTSTGVDPDDEVE